jgi:alpha-ketoglutarate-dependent taurine dioxygenase
VFQIAEAPDSFDVVQVIGVDASALPRPCPELRSALARHAVLCLRMERALDAEGLEAVARLFGPIKDPVGRTRDGGTFRYDQPRQVIDSGFVMTDEVRAKLGDLQFGGLDDARPGLFETFHCDDTYTESPAWATVLHARALPQSGGGPTCFLDMRAAWARLDPESQAALAGLRVVYAYDNQDAFPPRRSARGPGEALVEARHPLVRTHPLAGTRALYLDLDRALHVEGMPVPEGRALLQRLQDEAEAHAPRCEHAWRAHDVLVWDNASVQHKASGNFKLGEPRRFWRMMVAGPPPA